MNHGQNRECVTGALSPPRLGQLCTQNIHNFFQNNIIVDVNPICPTMPEIKIDLNGVLKLLSNLKPYKAAGPDSIKTLVLKRLENGNYSCYMPLIWKRPFKPDSYLQTEKRHKYVPYSKRVTKQKPANYRLISLTCILCKVMVHIIASDLSKHLTKHNVL